MEVMGFLCWYCEWKLKGMVAVSIGGSGGEKFVAAGFVHGGGS